MRMSISSVDCTSARIAAFFLAVALLAGCATKNPPSTREADAKPDAAPAIASDVTVTAPTGTQRVFGFLTPYRIDIPQGNFISREMVAQLKEGMQRPQGVTPEQVRFVMGTPLLTDVFHANRWDYVFRIKKGTGEVIASRVTVYFKDNRLVNIEGGDLPTEQEYLAFIAGAGKK